jgi:NitT/TauT family transport system permease protein
MARVFRLPPLRTVRYIYVSQVLPYFRTGAAIGLGLCWKAGIAAEVIGIPTGSIGEKLYKAKIYLQTPDIFAWTLVIILISLLFERVFMSLLSRMISRLERL